MKKVKNRTAKAIKNIARMMADIACGSASVWGMYQPKEPKNSISRRSDFTDFISPVNVYSCCNLCSGQLNIERIILIK